MSHVYFNPDHSLLPTYGTETSSAHISTMHRGGYSSLILVWMCCLQFESELIQELIFQEKVTHSCFYFDQNNPIFRKLTNLFVMRSGKTLRMSQNNI